MRKLMTYTMIALLTTIAVSIAAPSTDEMMEKEKAAWQAFKDKDDAGFQKLVDHDMVGIYADGIADMAKEMSDMKKWDMKSFKISDFKSHSDEKDVVVTSYIVMVEGTMDGKNAAGTYYAGTVWKMEKGKWLAIFHTDAQKRENVSPSRLTVAGRAHNPVRAAGAGIDFAPGFPHRETTAGEPNG